jgi:hypothetical protein
LQTDDVVNWIAIDAFSHCANLNRRKMIAKINAGRS